jgi:hypothetical protein
MRADDILAPSGPPPAQRARAVQRRNGVIGAMVAAGLIVMALAGAYSARSTQPVPPDPDPSESAAAAKTLERGGARYGLEIIF